MNQVMKKIERIPGPLGIFIGAALWSTAGGVTKSFQMDAFLLPAIRSVIVGLFFLPFIEWKKIVWDKWLFLCILSYGALVMLVLAALRFTTATNAIALQFTSPLWLFLFSVLVQHYRPSKKKLVPVVLITAGIVIGLCEPTVGSNTFGNILGALGGVGLAGFTVTQKKVRTNSQAATLGLCNMGTALILFPILLLLPQYEIVIPGNAWIYLIYLSVIESGFGYLFYMAGASKVPSQKATTLSALELVLTPVWSFLLVRELPTIYGAISWILILTAILVETRLKTDAATEPTW